MISVWEVVITGVTATALADLWQQALSHLSGWPAANWRLIGRWVGGMRHGVFMHHAIDEARPVAGEAAIGWIFHYCVGLIYAGVYLVVAGAPAPGLPAFAGAVVFGLITLVAPFLIMQPALGLGILARRAPRPFPVRFVTVTTHLVFGAGLFVGLTVTT